MDFSGPKYNGQQIRQGLCRIPNSWNTTPSAQLPGLAVRVVGLGGSGRAPYGDRRVEWLGLTAAPGHSSTSSALFPPSWSPFRLRVSHRTSAVAPDMPFTIDSIKIHNSTLAFNGPALWWKAIHRHFMATWPWSALQEWGFSHSRSQIQSYLNH